MNCCPTCHEVIEVGDWPYCPHGRSKYGAHGIVTDEQYIGGQVIENLGHDPVTVYSRQQLKQEVAKRGLTWEPKWAGPTDKYLTNWGAGIDPVTLENARVLVSRPGALKSSEPAANLRVQTFVRDPED